MYPRKNGPSTGLLVFTNDNMIFMQQQGAWSSNYAQGLRIPLEHITGITAGGTLVKHIRVTVGTTGTEHHEFINFEGRDVQEVRADIERALKDAREEKRKAAQAAIAGGTLPLYSGLAATGIWLSRRGRTRVPAPSSTADPVLSVRASVIPA